MAEITASLVKQLREQTGAGMMDCKKALAENDGDLDAAVDWLRTKGLSAAAKKAGRAATEGLVGVAVEGTTGGLVEVNAETDFVARNETFQGFVAELATLTLSSDGDVDKLAEVAYPGSGRTVAEELTHNIATIGENMNLRRAAVMSVDEGVVCSYVHNQLAPGLGKIGILVGLESSADKAALEALGKQLAMHIAAAQPQAVDADSLDPEMVERERQVQMEMARESGKPEEIVAKMVEGRMQKFYSEATLLHQVWVIDGESKVSKVLEQASKDLGAPVKVAGFVRFALGEGIEKEEQDFAAEVAATLGN